MSDIRSRLVICETTSKWAVALRRNLTSASGLPISETRGLEDCWQQAVASPASVVVLEITSANLEQVAAALPKYRVKLPQARVIVVGSRRLAAAEWLMRELGAVHVVFSSRHLRPLIGILHRHQRRVAAQQRSADTPPWRDLPWPRADCQWETGSLTAEPRWLLQDARQMTP